MDGASGSIQGVYVCASSFNLLSFCFMIWNQAETLEFTETKTSRSNGTSAL